MFAKSASLSLSFTHTLTHSLVRPPPPFLARDFAADLFRAAPSVRIRVFSPFLSSLSLSLSLSAPQGTPRPEQERRPRPPSLSLSLLLAWRRISRHIYPMKLQPLPLDRQWRSSSFEPRSALRQWSSLRGRTTEFPKIRAGRALQATRVARRSCWLASPRPPPRARPTGRGERKREARRRVQIFLPGPSSHWRTCAEISFGSGL